MTKYAYCFPNGTDNKRIDAAKLPLHGNGVFFCTTPGCRAKMYVRSPQKTSACFVSYYVKEHTGGLNCILKDKFKSDQYQEDLFQLDTFFNNILNSVERDAPSSHGSGGVGNNNEIAINSLKMLYLMCPQYRDGGTYNNFAIEDILVDQYNFKKYAATGIQGNRIVACTFWKFDISIHTIFMNCPDTRLGLPKDQHQVPKVHIENTKMFDKCVNKLKDKTHTHISVIAANWTLSNDNNCMSECNLTSVGKQICKGD